MIAALAVIAVVTLASAAVALSLRNLIRSVLLLVLAWFGIAAFYLWTGAEFAAFAQALVYGGAVSMVVLFAVLLSRRQGEGAESRSLAAAKRSEDGSRSGLQGKAALIVWGAVAAVLIWSVCKTSWTEGAVPAAPSLTVRQLGKILLGVHAAALLVAGVVLTVALLGGIILAAGTGGAKDREDAP